MWSPLIVPRTTLCRDCRQGERYPLISTIFLFRIVTIIVSNVVTYKVCNKAKQVSAGPRQGQAEQVRKSRNTFCPNPNQSLFFSLQICIWKDFCRMLLQPSLIYDAKQRQETFSSKKRRFEVSHARMDSLIVCENETAVHADMVCMVDIRLRRYHQRVHATSG